MRAAALPVSDSACGIQVQDSAFADLQPQFGDQVLPAGGHCGLDGDGYAASVSPADAPPLPWCHGLSSDADYYGPAMVRSRVTEMFLKASQSREEKPHVIR